MNPTTATTAITATTIRMLITVDEPAGLTSGELVGVVFGVVTTGPPVFSRMVEGDEGAGVGAGVGVDVDEVTWLVVLVWSSRVVPLPAGVDSGIGLVVAVPGVVSAAETK